MKIKAKGAFFGLVIVVAALMFSAGAYAKLVVLSYSFPDSDTQGFSVTTESSCGASFSLAANQGLLVTADGTTGCAGAVVIRKLVVLSSPIPLPSVMMVIRDGATMLDTANASIGFDNATPDMVIWTPTSNGQETTGSASISQGLDGQVEMVIRLSFHAGASGTFSISTMEIDSQ